MKTQLRHALLISFFIIVFGVGVGAGFAFMLPDVTWDKQRKLCDRAVGTLIHSKDLVEVVRAGFIVLHMECSITRRITEEDIQEMGVKQ